MLSYRQKVAHWRSYVKEKKMHRGYTGFPRLLITRFGREPSPLMFWSYPQIASILGLNYSIGWGVAMYFITWENANTSLHLQIFSSLFAGAACGFFMAWMYKREYKRNRLTTWDQFCDDYVPPTKKAA